MVSGLAGKLLGGKAGEGADLLSSFSNWGFKPEQIEAFLPKALELIKSHLSPELIQKLLTALPLFAKFLTAGAKQRSRNEPGRKTRGRSPFSNGRRGLRADGQRYETASPAHGRSPWAMSSHPARRQDDTRVNPGNGFPLMSHNRRRLPRRLFRARRKCSSTGRS